MAKSSKRATKAKAAKKVRKAATKKATRKKVSKKKAAKKQARRGAAFALDTDGPLGCCTLRGSGPDSQIEDITREECRRRAIKLGKNFSWVPGKCAEPF
jgi:hypothetical protein